MTSPLLDRLHATLSDSYIIERELGGGGMSRVFLAEERELGRKVVIKVLAPELAEGLSAERFAREIRLAAALQQANIVPLFRASATPLPHYTMPYVEGQSLRARLSEGGALPEAVVVGILRDVARALSYAHARGVVHRDIKPDNVLLSGGTAVVTDFGIAKAIDVARTDAQGSVGAGALTGTGMSIGTPAYMAPEQIAGDRDADHRADIYSFGTLAFELLAGHTPFHDRTPQKMLAAQIMEVPPPLTGVRAELSTLVMRCLAKAPDARPQTADELLAALDALSSGQVSQLRGMGRFTGARIAITVGVAGVAVVAAFGVRSLYNRNDATLVAGATQAITASPELEYDAALSPDGKMIAYAVQEGGAAHIVTRQVAGGKPVVVAPDIPFEQRWPRWSPDGSHLMFANMGAVYEVPALGGTARKVLETAGGAINGNPTASYSPDGKSIVYADSQGIKVRPVGDGAARIVMAGGELHSPEWSPDGRRIAYVAGNHGYVTIIGNTSPSALYVTEVEHPAPVKLTEGNWLNTSPVWVNDRTLLFVSNAAGTRDIYQLALTRDGHAESEPKRLTTGLEPYTITISRSSMRLAYSVLRTRSNVWRAQISATGTTSESAIQEVTQDNQRVEGVSVSSDGKMLVFDADRRGNSDIFRLPLDGGEPVQLTTDASDEFQPVWSPDGTHIAFYSMRTGSRDVFVMDADGRNVEQVTNLPSQERFPTWSPDGAQLAYTSGTGAANGDSLFVTRRLATGKWTAGVRLATNGGGYPHWSPDGRSISFVRSGEVLVIPSTGGAERSVANRGSDGSPVIFSTWSADSRRLYLMRVAPKSGEWSFWEVPSAGGAERLLLRLGAGKKMVSVGITFSTDDRYLYFTLGKDEGDVWTLDLKKP